MGIVENDVHEMNETFHMPMESVFEIQLGNHLIHPVRSNLPLVIVGNTAGNGVGLCSPRTSVLVRHPSHYRTHDAGLGSQNGDRLVVHPLGAIQRGRASCTGGLFGCSLHVWPFSSTL